MDRYIMLQDVVKDYRSGGAAVHAVSGVSFTVDRGALAVIAGPSGAGKTTVLNLLGGMDACDGGRITVGGARISDMNRRQLTEYRRLDIGFVFQFYHLMHNLTALENVELAAQTCPDPLPAAQTLEEVGLAHRMNSFPGQLSGGEMQRVAIARALTKNPKLLLCDEPTGALDDTDGKAVLRLLQDCCRLRGMTVLLVTHNLAVTPIADVLIGLKNGRVSYITTNPSPESADALEW